MDAVTLVILYLVWTPFGVQSQEVRNFAPSFDACHQQAREALHQSPADRMVQKVDCIPGFNL